MKIFRIGNLRKSRVHPSTIEDAYCFMSDASSPGKARTCRTSVPRSTVTYRKSRARLMRPPPLPPRVLARGFSAESRALLQSLGSLRAWRTPSNGCSFRDARGRPKFDIRHEFIGMKSIRVLCLGLCGVHARRRRRCCFVNYKLSRIGGHTHTEAGPHILLISPPPPLPSKLPWTRLAGRVVAGMRAERGHPVNSVLKQISSIIQNALREEAWGATSFTALANGALPRRDKLPMVFHILCYVRKRCSK